MEKMPVDRDGYRMNTRRKPKLIAESAADSLPRLYITLATSPRMAYATSGHTHLKTSREYHGTGSSNGSVIRLDDSSRSRFAS